MTTNPASAIYANVLRRHLPLLADGAEIHPDESLADLGLDSMGIVGLLLELEDELDITIPDDDLAAGTFATYNQLWLVVARAVTACM